MNAELLGVISGVIGIIIGFASRKLWMVRKDENRLTTIETSLETLQGDVSSIKDRHFNCEIHAQEIAVLKADFTHLKVVSMDTKKDIQNLYAITSGVKADIGDVKISIARMEEQSADRSAMIAELKVGMQELLKNGYGKITA